MKLRDINPIDLVGYTFMWTPAIFIALAGAWLFVYMVREILELFK